MLGGDGLVSVSIKGKCDFLRISNDWTRCHVTLILLLLWFQKMAAEESERHVWGDEETWIFFFTINKRSEHEFRFTKNLSMVNH